MIHPKLNPRILEGKHVRLVPARGGHAVEYAKVATLDTFDLFVTFRPKEITKEAFLPYIQYLEDAPDMAGMTVTDLATGEVIGSTCYLDIRPLDFHVEIGMTWYAPSVRGTAINPECKLLLLTHAFETLGARRVSLKTDGRNLHSQAAIAKLGAVREGTLRKHKTMPDGFMRDTVYFSIIEEEWPTIKAGLIERLSKF